MSGIAELLVNLGYRVSGSDARRSDITDRLSDLGARIAIGHDAAHIGDADVVVISSAVPADNPEVAEARARRVPVIPRAEMLAALMQLRVGIAVAGAHGKTTTTSMVAVMLERAGLDPTAVIGGRLSVFGSNARLGKGQYIVVEADESDRSFLKLQPAIAVITNIDREHLEAYGTFEALVGAFRDFAERVPFYGAVIACLDDPAVRSLVPDLTRRVITYGFHGQANVRGVEPMTDGVSARCRVEYAVRGLATGAGDLTLQVPGLHALQNALGAIAVGLELGLSFERMQAALAEFRNAERRYQARGEVHGIQVIDDYAHHPTEIAAVLRTGRAGHPFRLMAVLQPHRYSRTRDQMAAFGPALAEADVVVLTDIYPAGEAPLPGVTLETLAEAIRPSVRELHLVADLDDVAPEVARLARPGDLILTLGAGSIARVSSGIVSALAAREGRR
ncbi:MAG: UDP-N-acetylmuramate--L-alanine ligase [Acidobacteria bacterium]|nr:UDP-N-acetylmuramate--L-alanine ligase [Acidobacteriota bacterium]